VVSAVEVRAALAAVPDPEIPVLTIEDLGVLREVEVDGDEVVVTITPTYSGCPAMDEIRADVERVLAERGWRARVRTVLSPAWTTDWMTDDGRRKLQEYGIAPPGPVEPGPVVVALRPFVACPQCGSGDTEELTRFGSTSCKSMWRCRSCREPFDHFRAH
jgi:ring-1,2-phenylacetyl-CoA epoxidase subunit PaaD